MAPPSAALALGGGDRSNVKTASSLRSFGQF
jgi:hypothetical protein